MGLLEALGNYFSSNATPSQVQSAATGLSAQRNNIDPLSLMLGIGGAPSGFGAAMMAVPGAFRMELPSALSAANDPTFGASALYRLTAARNATIRSSNIANLFHGTGGGIIQQLENGYMIGRLPKNPSYASHVLISPQGGPVLYGKSVGDLLNRGF